MMNRRIFLRGLGGAVVAAPFLGSLGGRGVKAQSVPPPKRLIVMFTHYGCITNRFFPTRSHGELTATELESTTLAPLAPFAKKLLLPRGIRAMNEWTFDLSRGQGNDPHVQVVGSYFTCMPVTPNSDDPFTFSPPRILPMPLGPSLDHVMAQQLSPEGTPLLINLSGVPLENANSAISYSAAEERYSGLGSPSQILAKLTGLFQGNVPTSSDSYQAVRGKSILDLVAHDLGELERFDMSRADRDKLEAWKQLLNETVAVVSAQCSQDAAIRLGLTDQNITAAATAISGADKLTKQVTASLDGAGIYSRLAVLAAACAANPVIVLKYPANYVFRGLGITTDSHVLSHRIGDAGFTGTCVAGALDQMHALDRYYAMKYADLVGTLDSINEGDGTLLDNTAAVWFQEMSDGLAHNLNNVPIVHAGGLGGYFKTGFSINVEDGSPELTTGNSELFCADGALDQITSNPPQRTGTDPAVANAPINKYFCNLMNALGVKAGEDGFPLQGGQAEVTHFGMYDKTEDFIGGTANPPTIHDPGEFAALKANG